MLRKNVLIVSGTLALLLAAMGPAALAAPPMNDDLAHATPLSVPATVTQDTSQATTDPADPVPSCTSSGCGSTVWFELTPPSDQFLMVLTSGSDYDTVLSVYEEQPVVEKEVACNDDFGLMGEITPQSMVRFVATAGTRYLILVGSYPGTSGGHLVLTVEEQPLVSLEIDPVARVVPKTGEVTVYGTLSASDPVAGYLTLELTQRKGRALITGWGEQFFILDGSTETEFAIVVSEELTGLFAGGKAEVDAEFYSWVSKPDAEAEQVIKLTPKKR